jgi:hypothetical protein
MLDMLATAPSEEKGREEVITLARGWQVRAAHAVMLWRQARGWQCFFEWLAEKAPGVSES